MASVEAASDVFFRQFVGKLRSWQSVLPCLAGLAWSTMGMPPTQHAASDSARQFSITFGSAEENDNSEETCQRQSKTWLHSPITVSRTPRRRSYERVVGPLRAASGTKAADAFYPQKLSLPAPGNGQAGRIPFNTVSSSVFIAALHSSDM